MQSYFLTKDLSIWENIDNERWKNVDTGDVKPILLFKIEASSEFLEGLIELKRLIQKYKIEVK